MIGQKFYAGPNHKPTKFLSLEEANDWLKQYDLWAVKLNNWSIAICSGSREKPVLATEVLYSQYGVREKDIHRVMGL